MTKINTRKKKFYRTRKIIVIEKKIFRIHKAKFHNIIFFLLKIIATKILLIKTTSFSQRCHWSVDSGKPCKMRFDHSVNDCRYFVRKRI